MQPEHGQPTPVHTHCPLIPSHRVPAGQALQALPAVPQVESF